MQKIREVSKILHISKEIQRRSNWGSQISSLEENSGVYSWVHDFNIVLLPIPFIVLVTAFFILLGVTACLTVLFSIIKKKALMSHKLCNLFVILLFLYFLNFNLFFKFYFIFYPQFSPFFSSKPLSSPPAHPFHSLLLRSKGSHRKPIKSGILSWDTPLPAVRLSMTSMIGLQ